MSWIVNTTLSWGPQRFDCPWASHESITVEEIKRKISKLCGVSITEFILKMHDMELGDDWVGSDFGLHDGAVLNMEMTEALPGEGIGKSTTEEGKGSTKEEKVHIDENIMNDDDRVWEHLSPVTVHLPIRLRVNELPKVVTVQKGESVWKKVKYFCAEYSLDSRVMKALGYELVEMMRKKGTLTSGYNEEKEREIAKVEPFLPSCSLSSSPSSASNVQLKKKVVTPGSGVQRAGQYTLVKREDNNDDDNELCSTYTSQGSAGYSLSLALKRLRHSNKQNLPPRSWTRSSHGGEDIFGSDIQNQRACTTQAKCLWAEEKRALIAAANRDREQLLLENKHLREIILAHSVDGRSDGGNNHMKVENLIKAFDDIVVVERRRIAELELALEETREQLAGERLRNT